MGQCGCGDFQPAFKFEGPGDDTYIFQAYPSCNYCNTPAGIILYRMDQKDCKTWGVEHISEIKISDIGNFFGMIDPKVLEEGLNKLLPEVAPIDDGGPDFHMVFTEAVHAEFDELEKMVKESKR